MPSAPRTQPRTLALIAIGAMAGASARYGLSRAIVSPAGRFPWATWMTNVTGSLVLGAVLVLLLHAGPRWSSGVPLLATGLLGAYTTFSTFSVETVDLVRRHHAAMAGAYVVATLVAGLAAAWLGISAAHAAMRRRRAEVTG